MQDQQVHTTFGQLDHVADKVILPSTLNYRERAELQKKHACEYGRWASREAGFAIAASNLQRPDLV